MRTVIMTQGLPGSGKSTWTKEQLQKHPGKYKRINKDSLRELLDKGLFTPENESFIEEVRDFITMKALVNGFDVIIDDTNFGDAHFLAICDVAKRIGDIRVYEKYFDVTIKEAIKRNANRPNAVPEHVIDNMFERHILGKHLVQRDVYFPPIIQMEQERDPNKPNAIIVDLDGTLSLSTGREPFEYDKVCEDKVNNPIADLIKLLSYDSQTVEKTGGSSIDRVLMVSGREETYYGDSLVWLQINYIPCDKLFMRKKDDQRKDFIIKKEIYEEHIKPFYNVLYVIDDRPQVSRMFRALGLTVLQVNDLEF